jgi:heptosyltransferase-1
MQPENILIVKLSSIGDVVMATPVIRVLRNAYPRARISWLVETMSGDIVAENPDLDEVIVWEKARWLHLLWRGHLWTLLREAFSFIRMLRRSRYDLVLDLQGFLKSGVIARLTGARKRIGLASKEGSRHLMTQVIPWDTNEKLMGAQYRQFVRGLGLAPGDFRVNVHLEKRDETAARELLEGHGITGKYAVIFPFASKPQKEWKKHGWSDVSDALITSHRLPPIILGGRGDMPKACDITSFSRMGTLDLTGKTTLRQSAALVKHASLFIGGDTGMTHMAIGFGVPTVAIFGSTFPYDNTDLENVAILYRALDCSPCKRNPSCGGNFRCMEEITMEEVRSAVEKVLAGP